jgi:RNA polymerase primary sigma factor
MRTLSAPETKPSRQPASSDREAEPRVPGDDGSDSGRGCRCGRGRGDRGGRVEHPRVPRGRRSAVGAVCAPCCQLLSSDEECALAERIKTGDTAAQHQLILANVKLVVAIAGDYKNCGLPLDDLVQEGNLGLIRASQDFDPVLYGKRFQTYASFWIRTSIHRALAANGSLIQPSEYGRMLRLQYRRMVRVLAARGEGAPGADELAQASLDQIAEQMGVSPRKLKTARLARVNRSHSVKAGAGGDPVAIEELAVVPQPPESALIDQENNELLHAALIRLSPFEAWVIRERYGFRELPPEQYGWAASRRRSARVCATEPGHTYYHRTHVEIAHDCGLSVHHVRLVENTALDKLRKFLGPGQLRLVIGH